jgi:hypothetical protein
MWKPGGEPSPGADVEAGGEPSSAYHGAVAGSDQCMARGVPAAVRACGVHACGRACPACSAGSSALLRESVRPIGGPSRNSAHPRRPRTMDSRGTPPGSGIEHCLVSRLSREGREICATLVSTVHGSPSMDLPETQRNTASSMERCLRARRHARCQDRHFGDDTERALRADEELLQVVTAAQPTHAASTRAAARHERARRALRRAMHCRAPLWRFLCLCLWPRECARPFARVRAWARACVRASGVALHTQCCSCGALRASRSQCHPLARPQARARTRAASHTCRAGGWRWRRRCARRAAERGWIDSLMVLG